MGLSAIVHPLPFAVRGGAATSAGVGAANLLSPAPKEPWTATAAGPFISIDLGAIQLVDTFFVGFTTAPAGLPLTIAVGDAQPVAVGQSTFAASYRRNPLRHAVVMLDAPIATRYIRFTVGDASTAAMTIGALAAGLSIRPSVGHEWGAGRPIADTARVERLADGSFGIQPGATAGGWQWTLPALTDDERDRLYALALDAGTSTTVLVVENDIGGPAGNEAIHWGLMTKLEPYARQQPGESKWAMQVQDWA